MNPEQNIIFYFTASGNSLSSARALAEAIGDTRLVSMPECLGEDMSAQSVRKIGFMFPVYGFGPPRIVEDFLRRTRLPPATYHFAVASSGGTVAATTRILARHLRIGGRRLDAGYAVRDPYHSLDTSRPPDRVIVFMSRLAGRHPDSLRSFAERLDEIAGDIRAERGRRPETTNVLADLVGAALHPFALEGFKRESDNFPQTDACTGCGICVRICPRKNITMTDGRLAWGHDCEACLACVRWCPRLAIAHAEMTSVTATHQPDVRRRDLLISHR